MSGSTAGGEDVTRLSFECDHAYPGGFRLRAAFETEHLVTALFGPSGSGKTSVVEMIAGLRTPDIGRVRLDGEVLLDTHQSVAVPSHRRHVGAVFQDQLLFPHLSAEGNLRYGARRRRSENGIPFDRVVDVLELGPLLDRRPANLSGGERQRVAIGRALLSRPKLLLLDEPLVALDEALRYRILAYLERIVAEWSLPILFVSHGQAEVRRLADWVVVLDAGRVVTEGPPAEALATPESMAFKDASGPVNLLRVEKVRSEAGKSVGEINGQALHLPPSAGTRADAVYVQLAPEAVLLSCGDVADISARNHLRGTVRQLVTLPEGCFVAVDVGQILWAEVTPAAVKELGLENGVEVTCIIKTHSLRVVD